MDKNKDKQQTKSGESEMLSWLQAIILSVTIVAFIMTFLFRVVTIDGKSMEPYFSHAQRVVTTNIHGAYKYGDVVVIKRKDELPLIKRVVATPGQVIDINYKENKVFVDGVLLDEPFIKDPTKRDLGMEFPQTVPENCVFVMGDNRNNSDDSRNPKIGMVDERKIFGKVVFRIYPFDKFGSVSLEKAIAESSADETKW